MKRIHIIGTSCSGKTTFAKALAKKLSLPHVELDNLYFEPGWIEVGNDVFRSKVSAAVAQDAWVMDGNYRVARQIIWPVADTLIWLDYPFWLVFSRAVRRTIWRACTGAPCCNGNRESIRRALSRESIIWWVLKTHRSKRKNYGELLPKLAGESTRVIVFKSPVDAERWLTSDLQTGEPGRARPGG